MTVRSPRIGLAILILSAIAVPSAQATPIVAGTTYLPGTAIMDLTILGGTSFNSGPEFTISGVSGIGVIVINRDAQVGSTINVPNLSGGLFYGSNAILGNYVFGNIAPLTGMDFSGSITNVVQNSSDPGFATGNASSFQSGDFSFGGNSFGFEFLAPGPLQGLKLFTDPALPFSFSATFNGLPPSGGTVLVNSGPDVLNVVFNGEVIARSSNRTIVLSAVPEPSTIVAIGSGAVVMLGFVRRRKAKATRV